MNTIDQFETLVSIRKLELESAVMAAAFAYNNWTLATKRLIKAGTEVHRAEEVLASASKLAHMGHSAFASAAAEAYGRALLGREEASSELNRAEVECEIAESRWLALSDRPLKKAKSALERAEKALKLAKQADSLRHASPGPMAFTLGQALDEDQVEARRLAQEANDSLTLKVKEHFEAKQMLASIKDNPDMKVWAKSERKWRSLGKAEVAARIEARERAVKAAEVDLKEARKAAKEAYQNALTAKSFEFRKFTPAKEETVNAKRQKRLAELFQAASRRVEVSFAAYLKQQRTEFALAVEGAIEERVNPAFNGVVTRRIVTKQSEVTMALLGAAKARREANNALKALKEAEAVVDRLVKKHGVTKTVSAYQPLPGDFANLNRPITPSWSQVEHNFMVQTFESNLKRKDLTRAQREATKARLAQLNAMEQAYKEEVARAEAEHIAEVSATKQVVEIPDAVFSSREWESAVRDLVDAEVEYRRLDVIRKGAEAFAQRVESLFPVDLKEAREWPTEVVHDPRPVVDTLSESWMNYRKWFINELRRNGEFEAFYNGIEPVIEDDFDDEEEAVVETKPVVEAKLPGADEAEEYYSLDNLIKLVKSGHLDCIANAAPKVGPYDVNPGAIGRAARELGTMLIVAAITLADRGRIARMAHNLAIETKYISGNLRSGVLRDSRWQAAQKAFWALKTLALNPTAVNGKTKQAFVDGAVRFAALACLTVIGGAAAARPSNSMNPANIVSSLGLKQYGEQKAEDANDMEIVMLREALGADADDSDEEDQPIIDDGQEFDGREDWADNLVSKVTGEVTEKGMHAEDLGMSAVWNGNDIESSQELGSLYAQGWEHLPGTWIATNGTDFTTRRQEVADQANAEFMQFVIGANPIDD